MLHQAAEQSSENGPATLSGSPPDVVHSTSPELNQPQDSQRPGRSDVVSQLQWQTIDKAMNLHKDGAHCSSILFGGLSEVLSDINHSASPPLIFAFVAFTSRFSKELLSCQARQMYELKARREILAAVAEDNLSIELAQALCLLVYGSIAGGPVRLCPRCALLTTIQKAKRMPLGPT